MRKWAVAFLALALLLVGTSLPLVVPRRCPVSRAACERIKEGMTQAEVEAILGGPPGDYRIRPSETAEYILWGEHWTGDEGTVVLDIEDSRELTRVTSSGEIEVCYTGGKVSRKAFVEAMPDTFGPLELALWRLERLKERLLP
jgi:hypothetical protein